MAITTNFNEGLLALITDLTSAEMADISNAIFEASFEVGKLPELHTVIAGVREGHVIPIISTNPTYKSFPYKDATNCTIPECDLNLGFGAKKWELGMIACKIPICINTFDENFLTFWKVYRRTFGDADLDSALMKFILDKFQTELDAAIWRVVWFGDRTLDPTDPNYSLLRTINGIFTQAEADNGIKIPITQNTSGAGGVNVAITGLQVYEYLSAAYTEAMETPWFDEATARFEMTRAMAAPFVAWLNSLSDRSMYNCDCYDPKTLQAKRSFSVDDNLFIFGIPIHVHREFDGVINALNLTHPYRAILTSRDNILLGTSEMDQINQVRIWYSEDHDQVYLKGGSTIGASLVTPDYVYLGSETASVTPVRFVSVAPAAITKAQSTTQQFTAGAVPINAPQGVTWTIETATALTINSAGLATIGATTPAGEYTVTATSVSDPTISGTAILTVTV